MEFKHFVRSKNPVNERLTAQGSIKRSIRISTQFFGRFPYKYPGLNKRLGSINHPVKLGSNLNKKKTANFLTNF